MSAKLNEYYNLPFGLTIWLGELFHSRFARSFPTFSKPGHGVKMCLERAIFRGITREVGGGDKISMENIQHC